MQLPEKRQQALKTSNTRLNIWWKTLGVNLTRFKHFKSEFKIRKIFEQFNNLKTRIFKSQSQKPNKPAPTDTSSLLAVSDSMFDLVIDWTPIVTGRSWNINSCISSWNFCPPNSPLSSNEIKFCVGFVHSNHEPRGDSMICKISWAADPSWFGTVWFRSGMVPCCHINYQKSGEFM